MHGSFEAGILKAMVELLPPDEIKWDVLAGVSTGAINSSMCSRFIAGDEMNMVNAVLDLWYGISGNQDVYSPWSRFEWYTMHFKPSKFNTSALRQSLAKNYKRMPIKRRINIGATNYNTGKFALFNETLSIDDSLNAVMASTALASSFPKHRNRRRVLCGRRSFVLYRRLHAHQQMH